MQKLLTNRTRLSLPASSVLLAFVGLPFLGFGLFMGWQGLDSVLQYRRTLQWTAVDATINKLDLVWHPKRGKSPGYNQLACEYVYQFDGKTYTSDRVGIYREAHNVDSWHKDHYEELRTQQDKGKPIQCWVDPTDPKSAVLFRDLRPTVVFLYLLFFFTFGSVGAGLSGGIVYMGFSSRRKASLQWAHPNEPWMWNEDWARGVIPAGGKGAAIAAWFFAIFWNGFSIPISLTVLPKEIFEGHRYGMTIFLLFPVLGVVILFGAIYATLRYLKFGKSELRLATIPGKIGETLAGEVVVRGKIDAIQVVKLSLHCVRSVTTGSGKQRRTKETELWKSEKQMDASNGFGGPELSMKVAFDIPPSCSPTDDGNSRNTIEWRFKASADIPGVNLALVFKVPVFKVESME